VVVEQLVRFDVPDAVALASADDQIDAHCLKGANAARAHIARRQVKDPSFCVIHVAALRLLRGDAST
jgi:hypothetical protein